MKIAATVLAFFAITTPLQAQQLSSVSSNFDINAWLNSAAIPKTAAPDVVGAFRFICNPSHNAKLDPIVYPGQSNVGHLHTFFGNTKTDANSTYESLRTTGESSCQGGPLNRSAYWMPSMMNGFGRVVMPDYISVYYKGLPNGATSKLPRGLRYIFGYDMKNPNRALGVPGWSGWPEKPEWNCISTGVKSATIPANCPAGTASVSVSISSPECWDGKNLDSADHRSHMAYKKPDSTGKLVCPSTHPVVLPGFSLQVVFTQATNYEAKDWFLSSDEMTMPDGTVHDHDSGTTFHTDWFGAWDDEIMQVWYDHCLSKMLSCSAFELGNGKQGKTPASFKWAAVPRLVDPPAATATPPSPPSPPPPPVEPPVIPPPPPVEPPVIPPAPPPVAVVPGAHDVAAALRLLRVVHVLANPSDNTPKSVLKSRRMKELIQKIRYHLSDHDGADLQQAENHHNH